MRVSMIMQTDEFRGMSCGGWTVCLLTLFILLTSLSQAEQLPIKTYTTADGLVSNQISRIVRDSRGYLWFCTEDGLSRFDGYAFTNYTTLKGLPSNWVNDLLETRSGVFLVGTAAGLCVFDPEGEPVPQSRLADQPAVRPMFTVSRPGTTQLSATITMICEDSLGNIWCGTQWDLYRIEIINRRVIYHDINLGIRSSDIGYHRIRSVVEDRRGGLWVATSYELLRYYLDGRTERLTLPKGTPESGLMDLLTDPTTGLWVSTRAGLWNVTQSTADIQGKEQFAARKYATQEGLSCVEMTAIYQDHSGRLWAGTDYGLFEFLKDEKRFRRLGIKDIKDARVWSFNEDGFGNLWIGTSDGAIRLSRKGFTTFTEADGIGSRDVYHITESSAGEINLYTRFGDLNFFVDKFTGERFISRKVVPRAFQVLSFDWYHGHIPIRDHQGEWWWPTRKGLFRYSKAAGIEDIISARPIAHYTTKDGLPFDFLRGIYEDRNGDIWISMGGIKGGVAKWERAAGTFHIYSSTDGLPGESVLTSVCEDNSGNVWMGFAQGGIARYRHGRFTILREADGVPQGEIKQLLSDSRGRIWIASMNGGLGKIADLAAERPQITTYTTADGLASNSILYIAEDRANQFYVATNRGLNYVDFDTGGIKRFTINDGLANNRVDTIFRDSRGAFWFGSSTGVSRLSPQAEPAESAPLIFINALKIEGQLRPISEVGETSMRKLTLAAGQNQIEIAFGSPSFAAGDPIRYQYRLEGADTDWQPPIAQRTVNYANLAPGGYRFLVRAVNADGVMSETPASFPFRILPPVWQRWWALTIAALAMLAIAYSIYRYRVTGLIELERMRTRIAADLHDDIGANLTKISILSEVAHRQLGNHDRPADMTLSSIATISRESVASMRDIIWAINPKRDRLVDLTRRMRGFASDIFTNRNIEFQFHAPERDRDLRLSPEVRRDVFLIFKEAVNNVVRHSGCARASIEMTVEGRWIALSVSDDGKGLEITQEVEGQGLASMHRRAQGFGGKIEIISPGGSGTTVRLLIPAGQYRRTTPTE